jgi:hypothetical protein
MEMEHASHAEEHKGHNGLHLICSLEYQGILENITLRRLK